MVREEEAEETLAIKLVPLMVVIHILIDTTGEINMIIENNVIKENIAEVVVATAGSTNAKELNVSSHFTMSRKLLNLQFIAVAIAA